MKKFSCFMSLAAMLCVSLFFSCSSDTELPPPPQEDESSSSGEQHKSSSSGKQQAYYCYYIDTQQCSELVGANSGSTCPANGILTPSCPSVNPTSSSSAGSSSSGGNQQAYYCVYADTQQCLDGVNSGSTCPGNGILSPSCPFGNTASSSSTRSSSSGQPTNSSSSVNPINPGGSGPVSYYGKLKASGNKIVGSKTGSTAVQVRGVSLGWSNTDWESSYFFNAPTVNAMVDGWKAEIIRVPMGYAQQNNSLCQEYEGSYLADKSGNMARVKAAIDAAIAKGVYVIIDWHTHCATVADAQEYFADMASLYGSYDHVIFEIFNEPKGTSWGWSSIRSYATTVINTIRSHSSNLILVGTPEYDQEVDSALDSPLADDNVAYVVHFYAASHPLNGGSYTPNFASKINRVRNAGYPVFVSEYGTVSADGNGAHNASASNTWMSFLNSNNISYCAWHVNNKDEGSAFFKPAFTPSANAAWTNTSNMTASGQYIYSNLVSWSSNAPWHGGSGNGTSSSSSGSGEDDYGELCDGYCYWSTSGCVEIRTDPDAEYSPSPITTCTAAIANCNNYGSYYDDLTTCSNRISSYCVDYGDNSCILLDKISSCASWSYGDWEILSYCPSGYREY